MYMYTTFGPKEEPRAGVKGFGRLQEFNITIIDKTGRDNLVVDFLSRLIHTGDSTPVDDDFLDENLFSISNFTPWYAYVANYLVTDNMPQGMTSIEKQRIIQLSAN